MEMLHKHILVIGHPNVAYAVASDLGLNYNVDVHSRIAQRPGNNITPECAAGVREVMNKKGDKFDAVLIDFLAAGAARVVASTGYQGHIIGLVSHPADKIPSADENIMRALSHQGSLKKRLDELLKP